MIGKKTRDAPGTCTSYITEQRALGDRDDADNNIDMSGDANQRLQERLSRPAEGWEDVVMAALVGDPVFYGVMISISVCVLAFIGLLAAKVLIDQIEEEEQAERRKLQAQQQDSDVVDAVESKKQQ